MNISDLNPHIRYAKTHYVYTNASHERTICYDCRFFYIIHGSGNVILGDNKYNISSGSALFFPPATKYFFEFDDDKNIKIVVLNFDLVNLYSHIKSSLGTAFEKNFSPERVPAYDIPPALSSPIIKRTPHIQHFLTQCAENFLTKEDYYREKSSALLKLSILELLNEASHNTVHTGLCNEVVKFIHQNYTNHALTNANIADNFNYHPYHLNRIFKQETGKPVHQYLIEYRIRIAKNYLLTTQYSIEQISWKSGFSSTAYFIKTFKEYTRTTPRKYRQLYFNPQI